MSGNDETGTRWAMQVVVELGRTILQHMDVRGWNEFVGELVRRGMVPIAWSKGERPPPVGVMFDFRGLRRMHYRLNGINLSLCALDGGSFECASLKGALLGDGKAVCYRGARIHGARFCGDISGCDFSGCSGIEHALWDDASFSVEDPPIGLPPEVLTRCKPEPASAPGDGDMPSTPPEQPLRATVTITEVPW